jgi:hypothetical protein
MWHAGGTVLPARLLASFRPGTPARVKGGWRPSRSDASGSERPNGAHPGRALGQTRGLLVAGG